VFKVVRVVAAAMLTAGSMVAISAAPAAASSSSGIMIRVMPFVGPPGPWCSSYATSLRPWKNNVPNNPSTWTKLASSTDVTAGNFETVTHRYDGVTSYNEELECFSGSPYFYEIANTYDHRYQYVNYWSTDGGMAFLYSTWSGWASGYIN
jgi:hypothetical protein